LYWYPWSNICYLDLVTYKEIKNILDTYSFEEVLELNELTEEDVLLFLVEERIVKLPKEKPL